jgi:hypothetical protein
LVGILSADSESLAESPYHYRVAIIEWHMARRQEIRGRGAQTSVLRTIGATASRRREAEPIEIEQLRNESKIGGFFSSPSHEDGSRRDHRDADPVHRRELLAKEYNAKYRNQHDAELVDRCNKGCLANLQCAEVAKPRRSCRKSGERQKELCPWLYRIERLKEAARQ